MQVLVARIGKPHGIRGEVTVQLYTDTPEERFAVGERLSIENFTAKSPAAAIAPAGELTVASIRWNKKILVVRFEEISNRNQAEELRDTRLVYDVPESSDDEEGFYEQELLDLPVFLGERLDDDVHPLIEENPEALVGTVSGLQTMPAQDLLNITLTAEYGGEEILVPFVEEIVPEIVLPTEEDAGYIILTPPPGLIDLSQAESAHSDADLPEGSAEEEAGE
ncbi:MAG: ribosome maturation factor RimM [Rothia sp. (in: high G+C Gram-positive bacteria)]|uniref:ribosome maturation factor RimM n=1 Tax=Rothia sp. (in: high G+C Gram-positive bacteria) TaxID=1885016 RepID=UPI0026DFE507|nr:ribosome maturation factor RimM [Rothia sp. (in: high G+C Gram-positive bacteria)]MDO5750924.1 ribosome maturation factor RimM [Rothia sp. (in: high G+C Gram-positive bacteria)]